MRKLLLTLLASLAVAASHGVEPADIPIPVTGWKIELVAEAPKIRHPSVVCTAPDGRIFVAEDPMDVSTPHANVTEGTIKCIHPDGRITIFANGLYAPFGMQYLEGKLYVLHNPKFSVFEDAGDYGTNRTELIEQTNPEPWALDWNDHVPANFRLAMDGYFYVAVGDKGLYGAVGRDGKRAEMHGGIARIRPDGTGLEVFARGTRNILDVAITSRDDLFTYDNTDEHEWMGRLTHMVDGGEYGYPFDFIPRRPYTLWKFADYGAGAACGTLALTEDGWPSPWRDNLVLSDFGQRNLRRVELNRDGATFRASFDELLFTNPPPNFRPVGICETVHGDGLLICDWACYEKAPITVGRLWKLTRLDATNASAKPKWFNAAAMGKPIQATDDDLLGALGHPSRQVRILAQRILNRRAATDSQTRLRALTEDKTQLALKRIHALWALVHRPSAVNATWLLSDSDSNVRQQTLRFLSETTTDNLPSEISALTADPDPAVRVAAITALGRSGNANEIAPLLGRIESKPEPWERFALFTALNRIAKRNSTDAWNSIVNRLDSTDQFTRETAKFALRETYDSRLVDALISYAHGTKRPASGLQIAYELLGAVAKKPPAWKGEWWAYHPFRMQPPARIESWEATDRIVTLFRSALKHPEENLRVTSVLALEQSRDTNSVAEIRAQLRDEHSITVRREMIHALATLGDTDADPILGAILEKENDLSIIGAALHSAIELEPILRAKESVRAALTKLLLKQPNILTNLPTAVGVFKLQGAPKVLSEIAISNSDLRASALEGIIYYGGHPAAQALSELASNPQTEVARAAISAFPRLKTNSVVPALLAATSGPHQDVATRALVEIPDLRALNAYLTALSGKDASLRERARRAIAQLGVNVIPELEKKHGGLSDAVVSELRIAFEGQPALLKNPILNRSGAVVQKEDFAKYALQNFGDAWRGQQLFFDTTAIGCIKCHRVNDVGGQIGPDLSAIGAQYPRAQLIESVLYPSKVVRDGYQQVSLELKNGESATGAIKSEDAASVQLMNVDGQITAFPKTSIAKRQVSTLSLMPEGLHAGLSLSEFADLIAYVDSLRPDATGPRAPPTGYRDLLARGINGWHKSHTREPWDSEKTKSSSPEHWFVRDQILEHDGAGEHLWTDDSFEDFELRLEWRWSGAPEFADHPVISPEGYERKTASGQPMTQHVLEAGDSGVLLRGDFKAQANLFCYPIGSGEFWELRELSTGAARKSFTPIARADKPVGQWNSMRIVVRGAEVSVWVNDQPVINKAVIPDFPKRGPIGLQHEHGRFQFRNIWIKPL